jgi:hypothetical protein
MPQRTMLRYPGTPLCDGLVPDADGITAERPTDEAPSRIFPNR